VALSPEAQALYNKYISQRPSKGSLFMSGLESAALPSLVEAMGGVKKHFITRPKGFGETLIYGAGNLLGDLPLYLIPGGIAEKVGMSLLEKAGVKLAPLVAKILPEALAFGGGSAAVGGTQSAATALREGKNPVVAGITEGAKEGALGFLTGGLLGPVEFLPKAARFPAEMVGLTGVQEAETYANTGKIPSAQKVGADFLLNSILLGGVKGAHKLAGKVAAKKALSSGDEFLKSLDALGKVQPSEPVEKVTPPLKSPAEEPTKVAVPQLEELPKPIAEIPQQGIDNPHKYLVEKALAEGKPVPMEVLKEYPELQKPIVQVPLKEKLSPGNPQSNLLFGKEVKRVAEQVLSENPQISRQGLAFRTSSILSKEYPSMWKFREQKFTPTEQRILDKVHESTSRGGESNPFASMSDEALLKNYAHLKDKLDKANSLDWANVENKDLYKERFADAVEEMKRRDLLRSQQPTIEDAELEHAVGLMDHIDKWMKQYKTKGLEGTVNNLIAAVSDVEGSTFSKDVQSKVKESLQTLFHSVGAVPIEELYKSFDPNGDYHIKIGNKPETAFPAVVASIMKNMPKKSAWVLTLPQKEASKIIADFAGGPSYGVHFTKLGLILAHLSSKTLAHEYTHEVQRKVPEYEKSWRVGLKRLYPKVPFPKVLALGKDLMYSVYGDHISDSYASDPAEQMATAIGQIAENGVGVHSPKYSLLFNSLREAFKKDPKLAKYLKFAGLMAGLKLVGSASSAEAAQLQGDKEEKGKWYYYPLLGLLGLASTIAFLKRGRRVFFQKALSDARKRAAAGAPVEDPKTGDSIDLPTRNIYEGMKAKVKDPEIKKLIASLEKKPYKQFTGWDKLSQYIITPLYLADRYPIFKPIVLRAFQQGEHFSSWASQFHQQLRPFLQMQKNDLPGFGRVSALLFKGNSEGRYFDENSPEVSLLSPKEKEAYFGVTSFLKDALTHLHKAMYEKVVNKYDLQKWAHDATLSEDMTNKLVAMLEKDWHNAPIMLAAFRGVVKDQALKAELTKKIKALKRIDKSINSRNGYIPQSRFGKYYVVVTPKKGEKDLPWYAQFKTKGERDAAILDLLKRDPSLKNRIRHGIVTKKFRKIFTGLSVPELKNYASTAGVDPRVANEFITSVAPLLNRGFNSHLLHRKNVAGFSEDLGRSLTDYAVGLAGYLSKAPALRDQRDLLAQIPQSMSDLKAYADDYVSYTLNSQEEAAALRGLLFTMYLGWNVKSALADATQNITSGWPVLSQYTKGALRRLTKASKDVMMHYVNPKNSPLSPEQQKALEIGIASGDVSAKLMFELMGAAKGETSGGFLPESVKKLRDSSGMFFSGVERFNRATMLLAAFDVAREKGLSFIDATNFARKLVRDAHYEYGKANRPKLFRGRIGAPIGTFRTFLLNYVLMNVNFARQLIGRDVVGRQPELSGLGKEVLRASGEGLLSPTNPGIALLKSMGAMAAFSGLSGVLISGPILYALKKAGYDPETSFREWFHRLTGGFLTHSSERVLADSIYHGVPSALGVDLSGSIGVGDLVPSVDLPGVLGVIGDVTFQRPKRLAKALSSGDTLKAFSQFLPEAGRNLVQGYKYATEGVRTSKGKLIYQPSLGESTLKALGFVPSGVAKTWAARNAIHSLQNRLATDREHFYDRFVRAFYKGDSEGLREVRRDLANYNRGKPAYQRIHLSPQVLLRKLQEAKTVSPGRIPTTLQKRAAEVRRLYQ